MGKSSSSSKKKRSKNSSQGRTRKGSKSRKVKKYNKSKKLRCRDDSLSSEEDDLKISVSVSCSSSEDDYKSRRARSRTRKDVKGSKKRAQRRSYSSESGEENKKRTRGHSCRHESSEESTRVRKKIGSKRKESSEVGRKTHKKKPRREASVSSKSSGSRSCSMCQVGSTSSHEREFERHRGRSERREKEKKKVEKVRSGTKRIRYRSRSCSSCSQSIESYKYPSEEKKTDENSSKRLRSVITVMEEENEDRVSNKDEYKEEIVYDNDDYPSCRSNDSNDGGYKRELDHQSNVAAAKKMRVDNEKGEEPVISNIRISELTESGKDIENQYNGCNPSSSGVGRNDGVKGKVADVSGHVNGDNMESILRQRALENLIKFRGGLQTNANTPASKKDKNDDDVKQPSTAEAELVQINLPKEDGAKIVGTNPPQKDDAKLKCATKEVREIRVPALRRDGAKIVGTKSPKKHDAKLQGATEEVREIRVPALRRLSNFLLRNDEKIPDGKDVGHKSGSAEQEYPCAPDQVAIAEKPHENFNSAVGTVIAGPKLVTPLARQNSFKTHTTLKQTPTSGESHLANMSVTGKTLGKRAAEPAQTVSPSSNNSNEDIKKASGSAAPKSSSSGNSILAENSSNKPQGEATEGSQFEQKTMTVMRGGEMVQVSYKVYIPKKTSALARRQLKR
ncbi:hypothetical protein SO802_015070 [Lithocarpus litseifolius]|uniref:Uncharacterized protein n=1 Tax=Lithocarpus litseifolius TaxID=425828 RepID=A0AAW2CTA7_9ROSI